MGPKALAAYRRTERDFTREGWASPDRRQHLRADDGLAKRASAARPRESPTLPGARGLPYNPRIPFP